VLVNAPLPSRACTVGLCSPGHVRNSCSRTTLPTKPVAPVISTDVPARYVCECTESSDFHWNQTGQNFSLVWRFWCTSKLPGNGERLEGWPLRKYCWTMMVCKLYRGGGAISAAWWIGKCTGWFVSASNSLFLGPDELKSARVGLWTQAIALTAAWSENELRASLSI